MRKDIVNLSVLILAFLASPLFAASETIQVDATANTHPIDPRIYGVAFCSTADLNTLNAPLNRSGGNTTSTYNWNINADNKGNDWYFESIGGSATPGEGGDTFISQSKAGGAQPLITIPMMGYVAKLGPGRAYTSCFSIAKYGAQSGNDWQWFPDAGNGVKTNNTNIIGNDPNDAGIPADHTFQLAWVQHLISTWGTSNTGGLKYYVLDNEHSLWSSTHRGFHPVGPTMQEIRDKMIAYSLMIKSQDPNAITVGPEEWGWSGYFLSGYDQQKGTTTDKAANGNMDYMPWLLQQMKNAETANGKRLLDVFSLHIYPQGNGVFGNAVDTATQGLRNRSTRCLWDPAYVDESWIPSMGIEGGVIKLIPRMKGWVNQYYPGTPIGLTEYNWGAEDHINGATAQADIYGIFGREGLDIATRWTTPSNSTPTFKAMQMYRNYDGNKSTFGDSSCKAIVTNPDNVSAFAAKRTSDGALTVMVINKITNSHNLTLNLANFTAGTQAQVYQLTSTNAIMHLANVNVISGSIVTTIPAQSITLFIVPGTTPPPTYTLTVSSGTGSGSYSAGASVPITANAPSAGQVFDTWVINSGAPGIANATASSTTLTMPANAASVTATYKAAPPPSYTLTVTSGTGSGSYTAGTVVNISANAPGANQAFDKWVINSGAPSIANINASSTTLTMPANAASVTATYKSTLPVITTSTASLALGSTTTGTAGTAQSYTVSAVNLTANLVITPPANVQVRNASVGGSFGASVTLTPSGGTVANTSIEARISAAAPAGSISGNITNVSTGATTKNVSVTGTVTTVLVADINVRGNGVSIANGDTTPNTGDFTAYGLLKVGTSLTRTFTIENTGTGALNLTGTPRVVVSGTNASDFVVTTQPAAATVNAGSSTTFQLRFIPGGAGTRTATVSIASNDPDENPYTFMVQGSGNAAPDLGSGPWANPNPVSISSFTTLDVDATDADGPNALTYTWSKGTGPGTVTFTPGTNVQSPTATFSAPGTYVINVSVFDGMDTSTSSVSVIVQAPAIAVAVTSGSANFGNQFVGTSSSAATFTISNTGTAALTISSLSLGGTNPGQFTLGALTPSGAIAPGGSAAFTARFTPDNVGAKSATINIGHDALNAATPFVINLSGNAATAPPPTMTVSDSSGLLSNPAAASGPRAFGSIVIGVGSSPLTFTINNTGLSALTISGLSLGGTNPGQFTLGALTPSGPIAPGGSATFTARFTPDNVGAKSATVNIAHNASNTATPFVINLSGAAVTAPPTTMAVSDSSGLLSNPAAASGPRAFGSIVIGVGSSPLTFTINNTGPSALTISGLSLGGTNPGQFTLGALTPSGAIAPGGSATFTARFTPDNTGAKSAIINIGHNASNTATPFVINLSGTAVTAPPTTMTVLDSSGLLSNPAAASGPRAFGSIVIGVGSSPLTFTINNTGVTPLNISGLSLGGTNPGQFTLGALTPSGPIAAGGSATFTARFTPDNTGAKSAIINIGHNASNTATPFVINLSGNAVTTLPTTLTVADSNGVFANGAAATGVRAFGNQTVGTSSSARTFTITNTGSAPLTITGLTLSGINPGQFTMGALTPAGPIAVGGTATFSVAFTPNNPGTKSVTAEFSHNASNTTTPFVIHMTGNAM